jgi:hypothetical protein
LPKSCRKLLACLPAPRRLSGTELHLVPRRVTFKTIQSEGHRQPKQNNLVLWIIHRKNRGSSAGSKCRSLHTESLLKQSFSFRISRGRKQRGSLISVLLGDVSAYSSTFINDETIIVLAKAGYQSSSIQRKTSRYLQYMELDQKVASPCIPRF